ncbi:uncharacterized protein LOC134822209 [Bolinopsis microptera]|uniref:uncharacterized protein LOC134819507 n=1 Tax=Bolinopsis microptera TaxID=2820187 RepID=UPI00307AEA2F
MFNNKRKRNSEGNNAPKPKLTAIERAERDKQTESNSAGSRKIVLFLFHETYLKLEKPDFKRMRGIILEKALAPENQEIKIKDTVNVPGARSLKLDLIDEKSARLMQELITKLNNQWNFFSPAIDITPQITRIKMYINGDCPETFLKDKASIQVLLNGSLGKFMSPNDFGTERPPVWAVKKNGNPFTILHVGAKRIESVEFRLKATRDPYLCSLPGARIETKVDTVTEQELQEKTDQDLQISADKKNDDITTSPR